MSNWPTQAGCDAFYGNPRSPGGVTFSHNWYVENMTAITPPFAMHMGGQRITHIPVHKKCGPAFSAWLEKVWENAGEDQAKIHLWGMDVFSGSFNYRPMRGSSHLSMHAYGCAIDMDAPRNQYHSHSPHFAEFKALVVQPFIDLGGDWGGNWPNATDGMHFQFAHVAGQVAPAPGKAPAAPPVKKAPTPIFAAKPSAINPRPVGNRVSLLGDTNMLSDSKTYAGVAAILSWIASMALNGQLPIMPAIGAGIAALTLAALRHGLSTGVVTIIDQIVGALDSNQNAVVAAVATAVDEGIKKGLAEKAAADLAAAATPPASPKSS